MVESYEHMMGDVTPAHEVPLGVQTADVTRLHPPGTFAKNTAIGDAINAVAKELNVPPPDNVTKFQGRGK